jgi:hypothetical protein
LPSIEIKVIDKDGSIGKEKLYTQYQKYMELLDISNKDLISCSYGDLMLSID